jgi:transcriptional regulator with XRE-family HTH domain
MTQRAATLGVSAVHLSNVEHGRTVPSSSLFARFNELYGIDVYVRAFCLDDDAGGPVGLRNARHTLADSMQQALTESAKAGWRLKLIADPCGTSTHFRRDFFGQRSDRFVGVHSRQTESWRRSK